MLEDPTTAPGEDRVLVIDEHGDRRWGKGTAHVGKQCLANIDETENGAVSVSSFLADEGVNSPVHFEPYTSAHHFRGGRTNPAFRIEWNMAAELVEKAVGRKIPFRTVVADSFYGEDRGSSVPAGN